jgi:hypothetical protein
MAHEHTSRAYIDAHAPQARFRSYSTIWGDGAAYGLTLGRSIRHERRTRLLPAYYYFYIYTSAMVVAILALPDRLAGRTHPLRFMAAVILSTS